MSNPEPIIYKYIQHRAEYPDAPYVGEGAQGSRSRQNQGKG